MLCRKGRKAEMCIRDSFYRAAVPERIAFFHAAVKFRIHITVREMCIRDSIRDESNFILSQPSEKTMIFFIYRCV